MKQPNIIFIMADDHAAHAIGAYGCKVGKTPNLDRIANEGVRFDSCFCTNSICSPSRAVILTGTHSHINGVTTLVTRLDNAIPTFPRQLQEAGYQTGLFGKWHLGHAPENLPVGFDDWAILPDHGSYYHSDFFFKSDDQTPRTVYGYITDVITDMSLDWLKKRDKNKPFCLLTHHKAPHRIWSCDEAHAAMYLNETMPEPDNLQDDYAGRAFAAEAAEMRVGVHQSGADLQCDVNHAIPEDELRRFAYQRYIKNYMRVIASLDDNVGRMLDYLDQEGLAEDTIVIYTSDQGFFLGDHGWYDKRFMYEESLRMPFLLRYPRRVAAGSVNNDTISNLDFAPFFCEVTGAAPIPAFQGRSFAPMLDGKTPADWRQELYYRYWMNHWDHNVAAHYGIRTPEYKLIYYYYDGLGVPGTAYGPGGSTLKDHPPEWELFDLKADPREMHNVADDPAYASIRQTLTDRLHALQCEYGDTPYHKDK